LIDKDQNMSNPLYDNLFGKYIGAKTSFIETSNGR
jgi:hypothetical protein